MLSFCFSATPNSRHTEATAEQNVYVRHQSQLAHCTDQDPDKPIWQLRQMVRGTHGSKFRLSAIFRSIQAREQFSLQDKPPHDDTTLVLFSPQTHNDESLITGRYLRISAINALQTDKCESSSGVISTSFKYRWGEGHWSMSSVIAETRRRH